MTKESPLRKKKAENSPSKNGQSEEKNKVLEYTQKNGKKEKLKDFCKKPEELNKVEEKGVMLTYIENFLNFAQKLKIVNKTTNSYQDF